MTITGRLASKRCLVTAAGAGIGRASAIAFAREGAQVIATDIDSHGLQALAAEHPGIRTVELDVTQPADIGKLIDSQPGLDVLFNCAGYVHAGNILETTASAWREAFAINVDSMFHTCRAVLPGMLERGRGSIINMSSVASSVKGVQGRFAYGASKAAVIGLTKAIAADFVAKGVRCNAICPGTVRTPSLAKRIAAAGPDSAAEWKRFTDRQPMGRLGEVDEIAALVVYLVSDESAFTTGTIHVIDGGWSN